MHPHLRLRVLPPSVFTLISDSHTIVPLSDTLTPPFTLHIMLRLLRNPPRIFSLPRLPPSAFVTISFIPFPRLQPTNPHYTLASCPGPSPPLRGDLTRTVRSRERNTTRDGKLHNYASLSTAQHNAAINTSHHQVGCPFSACPPLSSNTDGHRTPLRSLTLVTRTLLCRSHFIYWSLLDLAPSRETLRRLRC